MRSGTAFQSASLGLCFLLAAGACRPAWAQTPTPAQQVLEDKVVLDLGAFFTDFQVKARLDGQFKDNPEYDFGKSFNGQGVDTTHFRLDGIWRITPSQHLRVMYFSNTRKGSRDLDADIDWGDTTYHAGAHVDMEAKEQIAELAYEWAFMRRPNVEVAATLGVHYTDFSLRLSGSGTVSGVVTPTYISDQSTLPVPLPVIGLRAGWAASPHWCLDASGQVFQAKVGNYNGYIEDLKANAAWMLNSHFGAGLGYNLFITNLDVSRTDFKGRLRFGYSGLQAFVRIGF